MKLRTLVLALVALCLTVVVNAHPIGKYIRHRNVATADHIYSYNGHGHDKYSRVYHPRGKDKNINYCSGLGHHVNCGHGKCHFFDNGHHQSRHCHNHDACRPHSGSSCGHHGCVSACGDDEEEVKEAEVVEETEDYGNDKNAKIKVRVKSEE